jgi:replicative DNA helicase
MSVHINLSIVCSLSHNGREIDPLLISEELRKLGWLEQAGGMTFISELTYGLPHSANVAAYAKIVKDFSIDRQMIKIANKVTSDALEGEDPTELRLQQAGQMIFALTTESHPAEIKLIGDVSQQELEKLHERLNSGNEITGVPTGFSEYDHQTLGLQPSDLVILAGRPSMGKTSFALDIGRNASIRFNKRVLMFSLEMSKEAIAMRNLCAEAKVDIMRYRRGYLNHEELDRLHQAYLALANAQYYIDDTPGITLEQVAMRCRRFAFEFGPPEEVILDHLQLMGSPRGEKGRYTPTSMQEVVSYNSRGLKGLAKEFRCPFAVLSQLSRASESRSDHRPQLSDLRESGAIEQDADVVSFLFREEYYKETDENAGVGEIITAKQRNGPTGPVKVSWMKDFATFGNLWLGE